MGKYNFSSAKFAEIEKKLAELEAKCSKLEAENAELKKGKDTPAIRSMLLEISNYDKVKELFGYDACSGELKATESRTKIGANFQTFCTNVLRAIKPYVRKSNSKTSPYRIVGTPQENFSSKEWEIAVETVEAVVDTVYYAKKKMTEEIY